jgi:Thioredoxin domain
MKIEILGTGCYNCIKLEALVNEVLQQLGKRGIEIVRNSDEHYIRKFMPLDEIPGMLIDGHLVSSGQVPERETLIAWLREAESSRME